MKPFTAIALLIPLAGCNSLPPKSPEAVMETATLHSPAAQRGAAYAQANCAGCHAVGTRGESPLAEAPHFRALGQRYPVTDLAEGFAEGIVTSHPAMPQFEMSTGENADLIAYLQSIQTRAGR